MNKLGRYQDDEQGQYNFSFSDNEGKHISVSFRAEPDYDLDIIFAEIKNFLIASGHDIENDIGEIHAYDESHEDSDDDSWTHSRDGDFDKESIDAMKRYQSADGKFSMDHLPNNGWPFGGLTPASIPALTTADFASLTVTDLQTLSTQGYADWAGINKYATMAPITSDQIKSWTTSAPGTLGSAKIDFK